MGFQPPHVHASIPPEPRRSAARGVGGWLGRSFLLAAIYFVSGKLGLLLAVPPGYATAIWPPSGLALVGILLLGARHWPGIWLGSFCVNLGMGFDASSTAAIVKSLAVAGSIGLGASMQAVAGAWLVRRFAGWPTALIRARKVGSFMALSGPVGCLIGATWGVATLGSAAVMPSSAWLVNWATWWVGDTLGVWIFATLGLIAFGQPRQIWRRRWRSVALPLVASFAAAVGIHWFVQKVERARQQSAFAALAQEQSARMKLAMQTDEALLHGLAGLFDASESVTRAEFHRYAQQTLNLYGGIEALAWIPRVPAARRAEMEATAQADGLEGFQITELRDRGPVRAGERPLYFPVLYFESLEAIERAQGFDLASEPIRRAALDRARDTGACQATAPIELVQGHGRGILIFLPLYEKASAADGTRGERLRGFVEGVVPIDRFVREALDPEAFRDVRLRIDDVTAAAQFEFVFASDEDLAWQQHVPGPLQWTTDLTIGQRTWRLHFTPTLAYRGGGQSLAGWSVLAGSFLFASLLGSVLLIITGSVAVVEQRVAERTATLTTLNATLKNEVADRKRAEDRLRHGEERFRGIFNSTFQFIGLLTPEGALLEANQTAFSLIGAQPRDVIGRHFAETPWWAHSAQEQAKLRDAIARAAAGETVRFETSHPAADGSTRTVDFSIKPTRDDAGRIVHLVPEGRDITDRKQAEDALRVSEERFRNAIDYSAIGFALVGLDGRWLQVNRALCEIVGYSAEELLPLTFQDITHPEDLEADLSNVRDLLAGKITHYHMEKRYFHRNGATVWIYLSVSLVRGADGAPLHFVSQIQDITERKRADEALRTSLAEKEVLLREVHHRVKNNMQVINSLLQMQAGNVHDPRDAEFFRQCQTRIHSMALVHDRLYRSSSLATIDLGAHLADLAQLVARGQSRHGLDVRLETDCDAVEVSLDTAIPLGLLSTEIITNAYKHAFRGRSQGRLFVTLRSTPERAVTLCIRDDGVGIPADFDPRRARSLGMRLISNLARQACAELRIASAAGTSFELHFSAAPAAHTPAHDDPAGTH